MRILQVTTDNDRRGAQVFALDLQEGLRDLGHQVRTVALAPGAVRGLDIEVLGPGRLHSRTLAALRGEFRAADVVAAHGSTTLPVCAVAGAGTGVPFVYRQIGDSLFWADTPARRRRVRWALRRAARVVALWKGAADVLTRSFGVPAERVDCIPNGVPADRFPVAGADARNDARRQLRLPGGGAVITYVGALLPEKGVDTAIDAVGGLQGVTLVIVGDGPARGDLERRAAVLDDQRVRFLGSVDRPHMAYAAADVVVLPSRGGDSMPATLIESGFMGRPAISTPVGAIPEVVRDGATGFIVPPDDPDALAVAIVKLCADQETRHAMAGAANAYCREHFSIDAVSKHWERTLDAVRYRGDG